MGSGKWKIPQIESQTSSLCLHPHLGADVYGKQITQRIPLEEFIIAYLLIQHWGVTPAQFAKFWTFLVLIQCLPFSKPILTLLRAAATLLCPDLLHYFPFPCWSLDNAHSSLLWSQQKAQTHPFPLKHNSVGYYFIKKNMAGIFLFHMKKTGIQ